MQTVKTSTGILMILSRLAFGDVPAGLSYSGETRWDAATATLTFRSSGNMPEGKEEFFWEVPPDVQRIYIEPNVTVHGGFRVGFRPPENPLHIGGGDRKTSVVVGTEMERWTAANGVADNDKWRYGTVSVLADAIVHVSNLTSKNPRGYHVSGYANRSVLHVSQCDLLDTRPGQNNNSDGFIGSAGSTISDCFISTGDDAIKAYHDMVIRNVTIEHHRNGAPIQFGWGGDGSRAKVQIEDLTIRGVSRDGLYNMAPFTWEDGTKGVRDVSIKGLKIVLTGKLYDEAAQRWLAIGLFELKPASCTLNFTATDADIGLLRTGVRETRGSITVNGRELQ
ncbi:MAG: hypothetical protein RI897_1923 [Verrucomicrobiota bacterium]